MAQILTSVVSDPDAFEATVRHSVIIAGAEAVCFERFPHRMETGLLAMAKGLYFREVIGDDGPLAAAGRLGQKIRQHLYFGKRRRALRTKQRSILARRLKWQR